VESVSVRAWLTTTAHQASAYENNGKDLCIESRWPTRTANDLKRLFELAQEVNCEALESGLGCASCAVEVSGILHRRIHLVHDLDKRRDMVQHHLTRVTIVRIVVMSSLLVCACMCVLVRSCAPVLRVMALFFSR
jgi:hypothetical protein